MRRWRTYRLCKLLGCTPSQLRGESAIDLDWLLACEDTNNAVTAALSKRSSSRASPPRTPTQFGGGFNVG